METGLDLGILEQRKIQEANCCIFQGRRHEDLNKGRAGEAGKEEMEKS